MKMMTYGVRSFGIVRYLDTNRIRDGNEYPKCDKKLPDGFYSIKRWV
jgi:hypothetical protein